MRKKTEEKRQAILEAAREVFRESGFDTASMSDIAERAEVSKATLYSYFVSKDALFMEVIIDAGWKQGEAAFGDLVASESLAQGLRRLGERHLAFVSTPGAIALARLAVTGGERSTVGREFYLRGPGAMIDRLTEHLRGAIAQGQLRDEDPRWMAEHLKALYEAGITERGLFGNEIPLDEAQQQACVARAVDIFLCYYGSGEGTAA